MRSTPRRMPHIDAAAAVAKQALETGQTIRQVVLERGLMDAAELDRAVDPWKQTGPGPA